MVRCLYQRWLGLHSVPFPLCVLPLTLGSSYFFVLWIQIVFFVSVLKKDLL